LTKIGHSTPLFGLLKDEWSRDVQKNVWNRSKGKENILISVHAQATTSEAYRKQIYPTPSSYHSQVLTGKISPF